MRVAGIVFRVTCGRREDSLQIHALLNLSANSMSMHALISSDNLDAVMKVYTIA